MILASAAGMIACVGCDAGKVFELASNVTGTIINTTAIAGGLGIAFNLSTITDFISNLVSGL
jgi:hypothetical protein